MTLGQKLKKLRMDKNLTQKDLAEELHVTFQTISKWENDENEPDIATLKELAKLYECSIDYLLSEEEEQPVEEINIEESPKEDVQEVTKTIIIHQKELHVCERCKKDIPEGELDIWVSPGRPAGRGHSATPGSTHYYHKACLTAEKKEREETARRIKAAKANSDMKKCFGWGIAAGVIGLGVSLAVFLLQPDLKAMIHPGLAVLYSVLIGYALFADLYCILSGSYIGEVFTTVAGWTIKFTGLIFSWDLGGFVWLIGMKILFAVLGFLLTAGLFLLAVSLSAALAAVSFPFVLVHNIHTDYEDAL